MQLSIIIINFNTPEYTIGCLNSIKLHAQRFNFSYEIVLIDNAPKQDNKAQFESCVPSLNYIKSDLNIGFGRANNLGMEAAIGKYFLLLNSDTILIDDSLNNCISYMEQDKEEKTGLLGCKLLNEDLSYQHSFYPFVQNTLLNYFKGNNPLLSKIYNTNRLFKESSETIKVGDVSGAFMLLRRSVFQSLNGFDPDFFLYCEETEWCRNRIGKHYDIVYYPHSQIVHFGGKSAPREPMLVQSAISEYLFWYKCGMSKYLLFIFFNSVNLLYFFLQYPFTKSQNKASVFGFIRRYFKAVPYWLFNIPAYKNKFSARKEALIYEGARAIFFDKQ